MSSSPIVSAPGNGMPAREGPQDGYDELRAVPDLGVSSRPVDIPGDFAATLADLARSWRSESQPEPALAAIVRGATVAVPGVHFAGITMPGEGRTPATVAGTDVAFGRLEDLQRRLGEGPGLDTVRTRDTVRTDDLTADPRWPALGRATAGLGIRSVLSVHLYVLGRSLGALGLVSSRPAAFDDGTEQMAALFAAHAAVALESLRQELGLRTAVDGRDVIGRAKGILMQRHRISDEAAFAMLVRASRDADMKLREVAEHVVAHLERTAERLAERAGRAGPVAGPVPGR
jgi:GAF domain-containing protein